MSELSELERKIQGLEDIEAIKRLKARYWNSLDNKQWDTLSDCYAEDVIFDDAHLGRMEGREHIIRVLKRAMKDIRTSHQGHNPEIEIITESSARGRWAMQDFVEISDRKSIQGYSIYEDEYVKINGSWQIKKSKLYYLIQREQ